MKAEEKMIKTYDGFALYADFLDSNSEKGVILLHMLGKERSSWKDFPIEINSKGFKVLNLDLRGHGMSTLLFTSHKKVDSFTEEDFKEMSIDIETASTTLRALGAKEIYVAGASIGANLALIYGSEDSSVKAVVSLSAGLNYHGIDCSKAPESLEVPVLYAASSEDSYSYSSTQTLFDATNSEKKFLQYSNAGHGTNMLSKPELKQEILEWLESH